MSQRRFKRGPRDAKSIDMKRRALLSLLALASPAILADPGIARAQARGVTLTAQDKTDIARIEAYLNTLKTLKARFLQVAPDGTTAGGLAWLERPGRMRFQYDPPSPLLLVAGAGLVVFYDSQLDQTSNFPLSQTPLGILLRDNLKLSGDVTVTGIQRLPGQIQVTLVRTASPGDGSLTLVFADTPLALRQWSVVDAQGKETRVSLFDVELGGSFDPEMFYFVDPKLLGKSPQTLKRWN
jgi:outer membrane lipoprotein-sorting protein